jgi:hypothetical protein
MKGRFLGYVAVLALLALSGCAGSNFVRPQEGDLVVGKAKQADVTAKLGSPFQTGEVMKNDKQLKVTKYAYAATTGESAYPGVTPARGMTFFFFNDVLVGDEFISSFKQDSSDFDGSKVSSIVKGTTTREDVIKTFGKPGGEAVYPIIKGINDRAFVYTYNQVKGSVFNMKFYSKSLQVSFNEQGVVTDVEYITSGDH